MIVPRIRSRRLRNDQQGVSAIVGAVLVFAILIAVLGSIRISFVPEWEKDAEWRHMNAAQGQMQNLVSLLDQQINNVSAAPLSAPFGLGQGRSSIFSGPHVPHELVLTDDPQTIRLRASLLTVLEENGTFLGSIDEVWTPLSASVANASSVESFRLRLDSVETKNDGDSILLSLIDADGNFAGDLRMTVTKHSSDFSVQIIVRDASLTTLYSQGEAYLDDVSPYFLDLMDPRFRFDQVIAATEVPFTVDIDLINDPNGHDDNNGHADLSASYAITYYRVSDGGSTLTTSGGDRRFNYGVNFESDPFAFNSRNTYYPNQGLVLENGAIVLTQGDRAIFAVDPNFHVALVGNITHVQLALPLLDGEGGTFSAPRTTSVFISTVASTNLLGITPQLNVTVETRFPDLWTTFWTERLLALPGYDATHFTATSTGNNATLILKGMSPASASSFNDLVLDLRTADVNVRVSG